MGEVREGFLKEDKVRTGWGWAGQEGQRCGREKEGGVFRVPYLSVCVLVCIS